MSASVALSQNRFENISTQFYDPLLVRGNTLRSGEDSLKLKELMELCTNLQQRVLDLEKTKTTQAEEIVSLKRKVKKLEQKKRSRTHMLKRLRKVGPTARVESSGGEESLVTLAQSLAALKSVKPKVKANVIEEPSVLVSVVSASTKAKVQDKGKGIMIEEPAKSIKKKDLVRLDEEIASKLQAKVDADYRLSQRLQAKEQEQSTTEQKGKEEIILQLREQKRRGTDHQQELNKGILSIKRVNTFVDYRTELMEESSKKAETELEENLKKAEAEVMEDEEEVAIDVVPLATKPPTIVDWKIHKEGKKSLWKVINVQSL
ncbi:hypothetical protein Tco_1541196 [Tanacetum coccineum]